MFSTGISSRPQSLRPVGIPQTHKIRVVPRQQIKIIELSHMHGCFNYGNSFQQVSQTSCQAVATSTMDPRGEHNNFGKLRSIYYLFRALCFYTWSFLTSCPLVTMLFLQFPYVYITDRIRRRLQHWENTLWGQISIKPFFNVEVIGRENLPDNDYNKATVYVANHESYMDIYALLHINRHFKFISKLAVFLVPMIGWSMFLTGHLALNREDTRSQLDVLKRTRELLKNQASVLFFPEGTRSKTGRLGMFKKGAFTAAVRTGCDVVPISVVGSYEVMPRDWILKGGRDVKVIVHKAIPTKGRDPTEVMNEARVAVASSFHVNKLMNPLTVDKTQIPFLSPVHFEQRPDLLQYKEEAN